MRNTSHFSSRLINYKKPDVAIEQYAWSDKYLVNFLKSETKKRNFFVSDLNEKEIFLKNTRHSENILFFNNYNYFILKLNCQKEIQDKNDLIEQIVSSRYTHVKGFLLVEKNLK